MGSQKSWTWLSNWKTTTTFLKKRRLDLRSLLPDSHSLLIATAPSSHVMTSPLVNTICLQDTTPPPRLLTSRIGFCPPYLLAFFLNPLTSSLNADFHSESDLLLELFLIYSLTPWIPLRIWSVTDTFHCSMTSGNHRKHCLSLAVQSWVLITNHCGSQLGPPSTCSPGTISQFQLSVC